MIHFGGHEIAKYNFQTYNGNTNVSIYWNSTAFKAVVLILFSFNRWRWRLLSGTGSVKTKDCIFQLLQHFSFNAFTFVILNKKRKTQHTQRFAV